MRLEWAVENPVGVSIEPGIGAVQARGIKEAQPRQTTTYVLTVRGPREQMITQEVTVTIPGTAPLKAVTPVKREIPKMPDGKPNLSGVYNMIFPGSFFLGGAPMNISNTPGPLETMPVLKAGAEKFKVVRGPDDAGRQRIATRRESPRRCFLHTNGRSCKGSIRSSCSMNIPAPSA